MTPLAAIQAGTINAADLMDGQTALERSKQENGRTSTRCQRSVEGREDPTERTVRDEGRSLVYKDQRTSTAGNR